MFDVPKEIYEIYCDSLEFTFSQRKPSYEDHLKWFDRARNVEDIKLLLKGGIVVGYMRIHRETKEISIAFKKEHRNKGYGTSFLSRLKGEYVARIRRDNEASIKLFSKFPNIKMVIL